MSTICSASGLARRFALILEGLRGAAAARMARPQTLRERLAAPLLMLLWSRLHRLSARFAALAHRAAPPRLRAPGPPRTPWEGTRLPRGLGWLVRLVPEAAGFGSQLQHLLSDPAMAALLQSAPQTARLLRPLCRMLAVPAPAGPPPATQPAIRRNERPGRPPPSGDTAESPRLPPDTAFNPA